MLRENEPLLSKYQDGQFHVNYFSETQIPWSLTSHTTTADDDYGDNYDEDD